MRSFWGSLENNLVIVILTMIIQMSLAFITNRTFHVKGHEI